MIDILSPIILTQDVLYRGKHNTINLRRPGHKILPRGTQGVVIAVADDRSHFEVRVLKPFHCVLTVMADELALHHAEPPPC